MPPILCSMLTQCTSLRLPKAVLVHGNLATNRLIPLTPRAPRHAGQHQVDDVVRHIVLAIGDEDLGAEDLVAAVTPEARLWCVPGPGRNSTGAQSGSWCRSTRR